MYSLTDTSIKERARSERICLSKKYILREKIYVTLHILAESLLHTASHIKELHFKNGSELA